VGRRPAAGSSSRDDNNKRAHDLPHRHRREHRYNQPEEWSLTQKVLLALVVLLGLYAASRLLFPSDAVVTDRLPSMGQARQGQAAPMSEWLMSKLAVILNDSPRIVMYEDFLDVEQCTYLILLANAGTTRARVPPPDSHQTRTQTHHYGHSE